MNRTIDYRDEQGMWQRALVPHEGVDPSEGVPLALPLKQLYTDAPMSFVVRLSQALFARGLIEPNDFLKPGAPELARAALLETVKQDVLSMISLAKSMKD